jgi:hypothetical protein
MATYVAVPVVELNGARIEGQDAVRAFHQGFGFAGGSGSFSDVHVAERTRHATADAIVVEQTLTARHTGVWRDVPPSGRAISIAVCTVYVFDGGLLAREHVYLDEGRLRHQLTRREDEASLSSTRDVILRTQAFDEATRFYGSVLRFRATVQYPDVQGFETGAFQLFVERGAPAHAPVFEVLAPDVAVARARLVAAGCVVVEEDPTMPRCYLRDPYGLVFNVGKAREAI